MSDANPACAILAPSGSRASGFSPAPDDSQAAYQAGYEAGLASGKSAGYRQGYREGFSDASRQDKRGNADAAKTEEHSGQRLLGLPCANCGCCFYSDETRCPRCKTAREIRPAQPQPPQPGN